MSPKQAILPQQQINLWEHHTLQKKASRTYQNFTSTQNIPEELPQSLHDSSLPPKQTLSITKALETCK